MMETEAERQARITDIVTQADLAVRALRVKMEQAEELVKHQRSRLPETKNASADAESRALIDQDMREIETEVAQARLSLAFDLPANHGANLQRRPIRNLV